jgi:hypothetical protein
VVVGGASSDAGAAPYPLVDLTFEQVLTFGPAR